MSDDYEYIDDDDEYIDDEDDDEESLVSRLGNNIRPYSGGGLPGSTSISSRFGGTSSSSSRFGKKDDAKDNDDKKSTSRFGGIASSSSRFGKKDDEDDKKSTSRFGGIASSSSRFGKKDDDKDDKPTSRFGGTARFGKKDDDKDDKPSSRFGGTARFGKKDDDKKASSRFEAAKIIHFHIVPRHSELVVFSTQLYPSAQELLDLDLSFGDAASLDDMIRVLNQSDRQRLEAYLNDLWEAQGIRGMRVLFYNQVPKASLEARVNPSFATDETKADKKHVFHVFQSSNIFLSLNVLGRCRDRYLYADMPVDLMSLLKSKSLATDDPELVRLAKASGAILVDKSNE